MEEQTAYSALPFARVWVSPTGATGPGEMCGSPAPKALGAPAWRSCIMSPRDICACHRGAVSTPVPVGGEEAVGAVETWAPDNCKAAAEIATSVPRREMQVRGEVAAGPTLNWTPRSPRPCHSQAPRAREPCGGRAEVVFTQEQLGPSTR